MDENFGCLLNGDGVVVLGDYAVCIDLPNEKVYVTPYADLATNYTDFIAGDVSNKDVLAFSTDDDVIDFLLTGDEPGKCGGVGGGKYPAYSSSANALTVATVGNTEWKLNTGVRLFRAGIYYRLSASHEVTPPNSSSPINNLQGLFYVQVEVKANKRFYRRRPCGSSNEVTVNENTFYNSQFGSHVKTFYLGTRNLNGYSFHVRARARYPDWTDSYWTPYGGRSINAPF